MKTKILIGSVCVALCAALGLGIWWWCSRPSDNGEAVNLTELGVSDGLENVFRLASAQNDALAVVEVTAVEPVQDVIEKYQVDFTNYTKITATVQKELTGQIVSDSITAYLLGDAANFPSREELKVGRSYLLRIESWPHEDGVIYLISPFESTFYRIHDGNLLYRQSAASDNYEKLMSQTELEQKYSEYIAANPLPDTAKAKHIEAVRAALSKFNYNNSALEYVPDAAARAARQKCVDEMAK